MKKPMTSRERVLTAFHHAEPDRVPIDYCAHSEIDLALKNATVDEVEAWAFPSPDGFDCSHVLDQCTQAGDACVVAGYPGACDIINKTAQLRTMEQVLVDLVTDDPAGLRLIDRRLDIQIETMRRMIEAGKGRFDLVFIGEDLGTQIAPLIGIELFSRNLRPRIQRFVDLAKSFGLPIMVHSCGSSSWAFEDFIEMGVNVVDTLQPEARNMAPAYLKERFGSRLAFHGMISTAGPVAYGTVDDVIRNVRETLEIMKPGGGYVLSPTHTLQSNSPIENVLAMYDAAKTFGEY